MWTVRADLFSPSGTADSLPSKTQSPGTIGLQQAVQVSPRTCHPGKIVFRENTFSLPNSHLINDLLDHVLLANWGLIGL